MRTGIAIAAIWIAGAALGFTPLGTQFDRFVYDFLVQRPDADVESETLVVGIDERTLGEYGGLTNIRALLADLLEALGRHKPAAIAIDVVLAEPGAPATNLRLAESIKQLGNVVLAANLSAEGEWAAPAPMFAEQAAGVGHVHSEPDVDGICRGIALAKAGGRRRLWALSLEAARVAAKVAQISETTEAVFVGDHVIPASIDEGRMLRIRYGGARPRVVPATDVLNREGVVSQLEGKTVFIGLTAAGSVDRFLMTPRSQGHAMPGVVINAAANATIERGRFVRRAGDWFWALSALLVAGMAGWAMWGLSGWWLVAAGVGIGGLAPLLPLAAWWGGWSTPFAIPMCAGGLGLAALTWRGFRKQRGDLVIAEARSGRYEQAVRYMSHEMRTPLTAIQGSSELIAQHPLSDVQKRQMAELIHTESKRLGSMLDTFLRVGKLSVGELPLAEAEMAAADIAERCTERAEILARKKSISLRQQNNVEVFIRGDRELLEFACYNLITNAIKYSPAHTSVTIRVIAAGSKAVIEVSDEGPGIPAAEQSKIFRRYYRTAAAVQSGAVGTGLGLSIVEEIVTQHQGAIELESKPGEGSTFRIVLPRATSKRVARR